MESMTETIMLDPHLSNVGNAYNLGVSEATVRRMLRDGRAQYPDTPLSNSPHSTDPFFEDIPEEIITSRGKTVRLLDGSYEKVTYQPARKALLDALNYDDLVPLIERHRTSLPPNPRTTHGHTAVFNLADAQIGKTDINGGTPQTVERIMHAADKFAALCRTNRPSEIVLVDNGDSVENIWSTPQQAHTNDLDVPSQIRTFRHLVLKLILMFEGLSPTLHYVAVTSNHGQFRTGYKSQAGTSDADFGTEISCQVEDAVRMREDLSHVKFHRPDTQQEVVVLETSGTKLAFTHGHLSSSFKTHGQWWARTDHGRLPGWDADILITAHYHSLSLEQSGDGRWIIGVSSPDPGSQWYTKKSGESSISGITVFDVKDGQWSGLQIL